jgi:hypothetical protein
VLPAARSILNTHRGVETEQNDRCIISRMNTGTSPRAGSLCVCNAPFLVSNKIGEVYSLEYTDIPKVFLRFTGDDIRATNKDIKRNTGVQGHCCNNMLQGVKM